MTNKKTSMTSNEITSRQRPKRQVSSHGNWNDREGHVNKALIKDILEGRNIFTKEIAYILKRSDHQKKNMMILTRDKAASSADSLVKVATGRSTPHTHLHH